MKNTYLILPAFLLLFAACSDDNEVTNPPATITYTGTSDFFIKNAVPVQHYTMDASVADTIVGSQGTEIIFPGGSLRDANNNAITGTVDVKLQEIYEKKDMFLSNVSTDTYYGYPLISGGMFNLEISQNGMPLQLAPLQFYGAKLPKDLSEPDMYLFRGEINFTGTVVWAYDSIGNGFVQSSNTQAPYYYLVEYDWLGWVNCDIFASFGPSLNVTVNTINNPNPDSTWLMVWVNDFSAMWRLGQSSTNHSLFGSSQLKDFPVTFIATTIHNGKIYAGFQSESTLTNNATYNVSMTEMSDAAFKAALDSLE